MFGILRVVLLAGFFYAASLADAKHCKFNNSHHNGVGHMSSCGKVKFSSNVFLKFLFQLKNCEAFLQVLGRVWSLSFSGAPKTSPSTKKMSRTRSASQNSVSSQNISHYSVLV